MSQPWNSPSHPRDAAHPVGICRWNNTFGSRQSKLYPNEDNRIQVSSKEHAIDVFLDSARFQLGPPQRFEQLRAFLERDIKSQFLQGTSRISFLDHGIALVDDRCDPIAEAACGYERVHAGRPWDIPAYMQNPPEGLRPQTYALKSEDLHYHLKRDRRGVAERRILRDLTQSMALAIIRNVPYLHLSEIRSFLNRHIGFDPYMNIYQSPGFVLEFHLPHFVIRKDHLNSRDERGLRKFRYFHPQGKANVGRKCIYETQISLLVFGTDDFFWTAYFFVDTYYGGRESVDHYLRQRLDPPSGGYLHLDSPIWDPRYYFLTVFSVRLNQVTMEWTVLVREIEQSLDSYSDLNQQSFPGFSQTAHGLERAKQRTWTLSVLRRLRNSLEKLITVWQAFESDQSSVFELDLPGNLHDKFRERFSHMRGKIAELRILFMTISQRIEGYEKMADELLNASALSESITATRQGTNIQILTYITIFYLPITFITGCFGMNQVPETVAWWSYWVLLGGLTSLTIAIALVMPKAIEWLNRRSHKSPLLSLK
ncbi:hypothetical protein BDV59DRAFT_185683 [Aspergillus ambiguus]|uniref:uncharacterized protein n=1 Tax=Aspergillus ambiguus TaxID=176160 RepID=UPI003CCD9D7A